MVEDTRTPQTMASARWGNHLPIKLARQLAPRIGELPEAERALLVAALVDTMPPKRLDSRAAAYDLIAATSHDDINLARDVVSETSALDVAVAAAVVLKGHPAIDDLRDHLRRLALAAAVDAIHTEHAPEEIHA